MNREKLIDELLNWHASAPSDKRRAAELFAAHIEESLPRERRSGKETGRLKRNDIQMAVRTAANDQINERVGPKERRAGRTDWRKLCEELTRYLDVFLCYDLQDHPKNRTAAEEALVRYNSAVQSEGKVNDKRPTPEE